MAMMRTPRHDAPLSILTALLGHLVGADPCNYEGGLPVRYPDVERCPDENPGDCGFGLQARCCPGNWTCHTAGDKAYCCASETDDCLADVDEAPKCVNPDWTLWVYDESDGDKGIYCCDQGYYAWFQLDIGVGCNEYGTPYDSASTTLASLSSASTPATCAPTAAATKTTMGTATALASESPPSLSPGAVAGIAVGCVVAGACFAAGASLIVLGRKRKTQSDGNDRNDGQSQAEGAQKYDQGIQQPSELHGRPLPQELGSNQYPELGPSGK